MPSSRSSFTCVRPRASMSFAYPAPSRRFTSRESHLVAHTCPEHDLLWWTSRVLLNPRPPRPLPPTPFIRHLQRQLLNVSLDRSDDLNVGALVSRGRARRSRQLRWGVGVGCATSARANIDFGFFPPLGFFCFFCPTLLGLPPSPSHYPSSHTPST